MRIVSLLIAFFLLASGTFLTSCNKPIGKAYDGLEEFQGRVLIVQEENEVGGAQKVYLYNQDHQVYYALQGITPQNVGDASYMTVWGREEDSVIRVEFFEEKQTPSFGKDAEAWSYDFNLGEQPTLVLTYEWDDLQYESPPDVVNELFFGPTNSMESLYREMSYGKTWFAGTVIGPYSLGPRNASHDCTFGEAQAAMLAANDDVDFTQYKRIVFSRRDSPYRCNRYGVAIFPANGFPRDTPDGPAYQTWTFTHDMPQTPEYERYVAAHEMGHTFGWTHSEFLQCTASFGEDMHTCNVVGYGNIYSLMDGSFRHVGAAQKRLSHWLEEQDVIIANSGTYALTPLEISGGLKEIIIPYGFLENFQGWDDQEYFHYGNVTANYSIEYRRRLLEDDDSSTGNEGVFVIFSSLRDDEAHPYHLEHLIDTQPGISPGQSWNQGNAVLLAGEGYHDNYIGQTINVVSLTPDTATIELWKDPEGCHRAYPFISLVSQDPSGNVLNNEPVSYALFIENRDSPACGPSIFDVRVTLHADMEAVFSDVAPLLAASSHAIIMVNVTANTATPSLPWSLSAKNHDHWQYNTTFNMTLNTTQNLLQNPSFEEDTGTDYYPFWNDDDRIGLNQLPDGYATSASWQPLIDQAIQHTGIASLRIHQDSNDGNHGFAYQDVPINPGNTYRMGGWMKAECTQPPCDATIRATCADALHSTIPCTTIELSSTTDDWTYRDGVINLQEPSAAFLRVTCINTPNLVGYGTIWCDDLFLLESCDGPSCACNDYNPCTLDEWIDDACIHTPLGPTEDENCDGSISYQELMSAIDEWLRGEYTLQQLIGIIDTWKVG